MLLISRYITTAPATKHQELCKASCFGLCAVGLWSSFGIQNDMKKYIRNHKGKHIDKYKKNHSCSFQQF